MKSKKIILITSIAACLFSVMAYAIINSNKSKVKKTEKPYYKELDFQKEYAAVFQQLLSSKEQKLQAKINLYESKNTEHPKEVADLLIIRNEKKFYGQISHQVIISNGKIIVLIDTLTKLLVVEKYNNQNEKLINSTIKLLPEVRNAETDTTADLGIKGKAWETGSFNMMTINNELKPEIKSFELKYNKQYHSIISITTEWWKNNDLNNHNNMNSDYWITKTNFIPFDKADIDFDKEIEKILKIKGKNNIELSQAFAQYKLHNLLKG